MPAESSRSSVDYKSQVLQAVDIVELIGRSVKLVKRGKKYVGLCPFHQEKTPSFNVDSERQYFKCWGCSANGNAIDFVMQRDRMEFVEAMRQLGNAAGIEPPRSGQSKEKAGQRQQLLDANSAAGSFFSKLLAHPTEGEAAREYLTSRGFTADSIQKFQLGFAPKAWDGLLRSPLVRPYPQPVLAAAGLLKTRENGNGFYDTFRNRLMFPVRDENGRVIAFGGRAMPGSDDKAKYLNSPETPVFSKSRCIFGLDLARQKIVESRTVAVVEGYTDVVMAHQYGATNVVSTMGTAMTPQHVGILRRFAERIVLLFDADAAGDSAVNRAVELFLTQPVEIAIASMPDGLDPDEFLLQHGLPAFEALLRNASDALTYKWRILDQQFNANGNDLTGQQRAVQQYLETLSAARGSGPVDAIRWGSAVARVSRLTDIPVEELNRRFRTGSSTPNQARPREELRPESPQFGETEEVAETGPVLKRPVIVTARDRSESWILSVLLLEPALWEEVQQQIHVEDFLDDTRRELARAYWEYQRDEGIPVFNEFLGSLKSPVLRDLAIELVEEIAIISDSAAVLRDAFSHLSEIRTGQERQKLLAELRRTDGTASADPGGDLLRKLQEKARQPDLRRVGS